MARYGMAIDLDRCTGCTACVTACKIENNTTEGAFWMWVFKSEKGSFPDTEIDNMPRPCMHCDNAPCEQVCPVGARFTDNDGIVLTDFERCIGCRYCEVNCPYGVNNATWEDPKSNHYFDYPAGEGSNVYGPGSLKGTLPNRNPDHDIKIDGRLVSGGDHYRGTMTKCTFCVHRVKKGLLPSCVANCPDEALIFGDLDDPSSPVSEAIRHKQSWRLLEELGTQPKVFYLEGRPPNGDERMLNARVGRTA